MDTMSILQQGVPSTAAKGAPDADLHGLETEKLPDPAPGLAVTGVAADSNGVHRHTPTGDDGPAQPEAEKAGELATDRDDLTLDPVSVPDSTRLAPATADGAATLAPLDLSAVEQGIQKLFEQINHLDAQLRDGPAGTGAASWLMALAAAGAACEIARRQMRSLSSALEGGDGAVGTSLAWWSGITGTPPLDPT
jgi:hypothetical protein